MKGLIYSEQLAMFDNREIIGYGKDDFYVKEMPRKEADKLIINNHYSRKVVVIGHHKIDLGVYIDSELVGVLQYGYAMNPASAGSVVEGTETNQYLELNRMWLDDKAPRNSESQAISYSIKYIKNKHKKIKWIQSFADERCGGLGIVYQACSFDFYGEHLSIFWELDNEFIHNSRFTNTDKKSNSRYEYYKANKHRAKKHELRQFRYIKFLDKRWIKKCTKKEMPYLKHYNDD